MLTTAGLPVPPGFVIGAPAYAAFCELIGQARNLGLGTSICGQAPSVHPEYAELLVRAGIDCVSVNTDVVDPTRRLIAAAEQRVLLDAARDRSTRARQRSRLTRDDDALSSATDGVGPACRLRLGLAEAVRSELLDARTRGAVRERAARG